MKIEEFCLKLGEQLAARESEEERLRLAVEALSKAFGVRQGEVAFFTVDAGGDSLSFRWPVAFRSAGSIPLSSRNSLVSRTVQEKQPFLNNSFAATPHAFFFEQFRKDESAAGGLPVQKIMSVPLLSDGSVTGVIQVTRKGESVLQAGQDFTPLELQALTRIAATIAQHLQA